MATVAPSHPLLEASPDGATDEMGRLGHYRVIRQLGQGGMGYVFEAEDSKLRRRVALKVMNQKIAATDGSRKRFITEARAMAAIRHDNVATIFEVGQRGDTPFMAMEMLAGQTIEQLNAKIRGGQTEPVPWAEIIRLGQQICWGLAAAHERGIVHRDIKPANLWIESQLGRVKVLDFGLALAQTPVDSLAGRGSVIGTPGYLSPEQARGEPLDDRSDLYSLGVVLFELATGQLPIKSKSIHEQLIAILIQKPPAVCEVNPAMPTPLSDAIAKLLRKEPRSRYGSAAELATDFDEIRRQCERTSEVAQTIDKLKNTLQSVAVVPAAPAIPVTAPATRPTPAADFSGIDEMLSGLPPATAAFATDPLSGSSGSMPAVGLPAGQRSSPGRRPKHPNKTTSPGASYLPLAIIGAVLLLALPLMTYLFTTAGRSGNVIYTADGSTIDADRPNTTPPPPQPPKRSTSQPPANKPTPPAASGAKISVPPPANNQPPVAPEPAATPVPPPTSVTPPPAPAPPPAPVQLRSQYVSTADGRGADAVVVRGSTTNRGADPLLAVQTRGDKPVRHTYLRFDLQSIGDLSKLKHARVALLADAARPIGLDLSLYAVNLKGAWPEEAILWNNSFSATELSGLAEVATMKVGPGQSRILVLGSTALADFIRGQGSDLVTLVVAGKWNDDMAQFVSKETSPQEAPRLQLAFEP